MTSSAFLSRPFLLVLLAQLSFGFSFGSFLIFPKYMKLELSSSASEIGTVAAVHLFTAMVFLVVFGVLTDRIGRKKIWTSGALLMGISSLAFLNVEVMGPLLISLRMLQGLAFAMVFSAGLSLTVDLAPKERLAQAIGFFGLTMLSMNAIGTTAMEWISEMHGWPFSFAIASLGSFLCFFLTFFVPETQIRKEQADDVPSLLEVIRRPLQLRVGFVMICTGLAFHSMFVLMQPFALTLGITRVSSFFVAYTTLAVFVRLGLGGTADRFGYRRVALASLLVYFATTVSAALLGNLGLIMVGASLGLAHGFFYPAFNALALQGASAVERGKIVSLFQSWFSLGGAVGPFVLGVVADRSGYPTAFILAAVLVLGAVVIVATMRLGDERVKAGAIR